MKDFPKPQCKSMKALTLDEHDLKKKGKDPQFGYAWFCSKLVTCLWRDLLNTTLVKN